jgi:predicted porin
LKISGLYYAGKYDDTGLDDATKNRMIGMVSYQGDKFTVAGQYLTSNDKGKTGAGFGGFGILKLTDKISPFFRYETFDPNTDTDSKNDEHTRIIAGVSYKLAKKVVVAIDYQSEDYKSPDDTDKSALYLHMRVKY